MKELTYPTVRVYLLAYIWGIIDDVIEYQQVGWTGCSCARHKQNCCGQDICSNDVCVGIGSQNAKSLARDS